jgi:NADP-dependent 3-hydroxy acid dehydrogenase YdfG
MTAPTDRVAVVTGASSVTGAGLAAMLADEGARVVVLAARRGAHLEAVAAGMRQAGGAAVPVVTDLAEAPRSPTRWPARSISRPRTIWPQDCLVSRRGKHPVTPPQQVGQQRGPSIIGYRGSCDCRVLIVSHNPS